MPKPFQIFSWHRPFLPDLKALLTAETEGQPGRALIITPHKRPWRYLAELYAKDGRTAILPKVLAIDEVIDIWNADSPESVLHLANQLDQTAALHQCVRALADQDARLAARFAAMDLQTFLPWGLRLAALLEELFTHAIKPADIAYAGNEAQPYAAELLGALGRIGRHWRQQLTDLGWTTPGLATLEASRRSEAIPPLLLPSPGRPVYIAGFYALNGGEEKLLKALWRHGASVCLHTDPALASGGAHPHCQEHAAWLRRWGAAAVAGNDAAPRAGSVSFFAGYDLHSQLLELRGNLADDPLDAPSTAVILPNPSLLLPALRHIGPRDVNISMGYPLQRTLLHSLLESSLRLAEHTDAAGAYHWKELLELLRHPFFAMLHDPANPEISAQAVLPDLIGRITAGPRFVDLDRALAAAAENDPEGQEFVRACLAVLLEGPAKAATTRELGLAIEAITALLLASGTGIWERFPIDAESLTRLQTALIPVLKNNRMADEPLPRATLTGLARELMGLERIPFEADPLVGVQIMGLLETRLLQFERVFIIDATDDNLPGQQPHDPLLPDSLRGLIGLPDARSREAVMAHNLFRLCAGAGETRFFWQEGIGRSALFDSKKSRSRFVEQLIWREEQKRGQLLEAGSGPLAAARAALHMPLPARNALPASAPLLALLWKFLSGPLSPGKLDTYMSCPQRFAWAHLFRLQPPPRVNEGENAQLAGQFIHSVLQAVYEEWQGRELPPGAITMEKIQAAFASKFAELELAKNMPLESCLMLEEAGIASICRYAASQKRPVRIIGLEREVTQKLAFGRKKRAFRVRIDRIDRREGSLHVLDYKTGNLPKCDPDLWTDAAFFSRVAPYSEGERAYDAEADSLLADLRERLPSLQLPCYLAVLGQGGEDVGNAAYVDLKNKSQEVWLFRGLDKDETARALAYAVNALGFVSGHLAARDEFAAHECDACAWCEYAGLCRA